MKTTLLSILSLLAAGEVAAHSTFQELWVNGVDQGGTCARLPPSNSPVTSISSTDMRCNVNGGNGVSGKCSVNAGGRVTVEMHAQPNTRDCSQEAIGGAHYGPVLVYLSKVTDSSSDDGSGGWFKIFQDTWAKLPGSSRGDDDYWGTKDLNSCCGKMDVAIPTNIPSGDYLLRSEVIALHAASTSGGYQVYVTCFQLTVTGGSGSVPATVKFPGAYTTSDTGIFLSIHSDLESYKAPGPAVISGGTERTAGTGTCPVTGGTGTTGTTKSTTVGVKTSTTSTTSTTTLRTSTTSTTSTKAVTTTAASGGGGGGTCAQYGQCGGTGWTGCTSCPSGWTCKVTNTYYSQCNQ